MPLPSDYNDAIQALTLKFKDPIIKQGSIAERDAMGLPIPYSGNFACVYKIRADGKIWALRFFLVITPKTTARYKAIKNFFNTSNCDFFVDFDFQEDAVLISGKWHPMVKMPWIDGRTLDRFVNDNLATPNKIEKIANDFSKIIFQLKILKIAHGDLQHGNILVTNSGLKLIDYDCFFCSTTKTIATNEIGMPNYQHPKRKATDIGENIDDFSAWIIYISLKIISKDVSYFNNNDTLIFEKDDFEFPKNSRRIKSIIQHKDSEIRAFGKFIVNALLSPTVQSVPKFDLSTITKFIGSDKTQTNYWWTDSRSNKTKTIVNNSTWIKDWLKKN